MSRTTVNKTQYADDNETPSTLNLCYASCFSIWHSKHNIFIFKILKLIKLKLPSHQSTQSHNISTVYLCYVFIFFYLLKWPWSFSDLKQNIKLNILFIPSSSFFLQSASPLSHQMSSFRKPVTLNCLRPGHDPLSHLSIYFLKVAICISRPCQLQNSFPLLCHIHN